MVGLGTSPVAFSFSVVAAFHSPPPLSNCLRSRGGEVHSNLPKVGRSPFILGRLHRSVIARAWSLSLVLAPPWPTTSAWARPAGPGAVTLSPAPGRQSAISTATKKAVTRGGKARSRPRIYIYSCSIRTSYLIQQHDSRFIGRYRTHNYFKYSFCRGVGALVKPGPRHMEDSSPQWLGKKEPV